MKKYTVFISFLVIMLLLSSCNSSGKFTKTDEEHITAPDGTEYILLGYEGVISTFGSKNIFLGKIKGEKSSFVHLTSRIKTGLYSIENDPDQDILIRSVPDNEWQAYYRKTSLPEIELTPDSCIRFELVTEGYQTNIKHLSCNEGIAEPDMLKAFLADIRSQKTAEEAGLYDLVKKPDGMLENCYEYGIVYGFFKEESHIAIPFHVTSFNDKAYSIRLDDHKEYVLPDKWFSELK